MEFDFEKFNAAYQAADQKTKNMIDSGAISDSVEQVSGSALGETKPATVILLLSEYVLKVRTMEETVEAIKALNNEALSATVYPLIESVQKATAATPDTIAVAAPAAFDVPAPAESDTQPTAEPVNHLEPMRTMASDMAHEGQLHSSTQDDLLTDGGQSQSADAPPRWQTEVE